MKKIVALGIILSMSVLSFAQTDTTGRNNYPASDTIKVGGIIIIRKAGHHNDTTGNNGSFRHHFERKQSNISTNWWIVDLGFSNFTDKSDYTAARSDGFVSAGMGKEQLKLRSGKSRNVNLWFFMQKMNIASHVLNFKYGLGLELNNYFFDDTKIVFQKNPTYITDGTTDFKKVKLAADYLTAPIMLNINFTPQRKEGFGFSAGISAGYLYSSRYKTKLDRDVKKTKSDFDLEKFKLSYIAELTLGPVKLYGSVASKSMWSKSLDVTPYTFGFRFSNW
jgi:hypothetical protein